MINYLATVFFTVLSGILVYVLGQIYSKFYIEPVNNLLEIIGQATYILIYYASIYGNPGTGHPQKSEEAEIQLRKLASQLRAKNHVIKRKGIFAIFLKKHVPIPTEEEVNKAASEIIGLSNNLDQENKIDDNMDRIKRVEKFLHIRIT